MSHITRQQKRAAERAARKAAKRRAPRARPAAGIGPGAALAVGLFAAAHPAQAATFTVTNTTDGIPAPPGSLREAIEAANANPGPDVIDFAAGVTGTIVLDDPDDGGPIESQLVVTDSVEIQGPGAADLAVSGNDETRIFYLLYAYGGTPIDVTISGLTITDGATDGDGGGISDIGANLVLDAVAITGNDATGCCSIGGGVYIGGEAATLTVRDSVISGNTAGGGGGLAAYYLAGDLTIERTEITGNQAADYAGGLAIAAILGNVTLDTVTVTGNTAATGGGLLLYLAGLGGMTIRDSVISGNDATEGPGGGAAVAFPLGDMLVEETTISGNDALADSGGGIYVYDVVGAQLTLRRTTIDGNTAALDGGGVALLNSALEVENSTISGNTAGGNGGGLALYQQEASQPAAIHHSTVAGNTAGEIGGGLYLFAPGTMEVAHTIVADNVDSAGEDLCGGSGSFDASFSLIESPGTASINDLGGNVFGQDPQLAALASNGGPTATHRPAATSPAVDAGDPAFAPPPATDQRLLPRVAGAAIDIGAVELQPGTLQLTFSAATVGEGVGAVTLTVTRTGGAEGAVTADFATIDGTATFPDDYLQALGSVSFPDGDATPQSFQVTIVDDDAIEGAETFSVQLSNPQGGATLGTPAAAVVTILDNEANVVAIPTLGDAGRLLLAGLLGLGGLLALRQRNGRGAAAGGGLAAPALLLTLALGDPLAAAAAVQPQADPGRPVAEREGAALRRPDGSVETHVTTLAEVRFAGEAIHLRLADGTTLTIEAERLVVRDRRQQQRRRALERGTAGGTAQGEARQQGSRRTVAERREARQRRAAATRAWTGTAADLAAGQAVVLRVRRAADGTVLRARVVVAESLEAARAAAAHRAAGPPGHRQ